MRQFRLVAAGAVAFSVLSGPASAHDFWVALDDFRPGAEATIAADFMVGHGMDQSRWPSAAYRFVTLDLVGEEERRTLFPEIVEADSGTMVFEAAGDGDYVLAMASTPAFIRLEAELFNSYIEDEGITPIILHRTAERQMEEPGTELYSRRGKALLRVGEGGSGEVFTRPVGLTLEITPLADPYGTAPGEEIPVRVTYLGAPVSGATIHIGRIDAALEDEPAPLKTGADGEAMFEIPEGGDWYLHVVWGEPADNLPGGADYQTIFASLSMGFGEAAAE